MTHCVLNPRLTLSFYFPSWEDKRHCCFSVLHPNSLSLIETQSELTDRQRTVVRRGCSIYKHWLHLGWIPCPLACGYITRQDNSLAAAKCPHRQPCPSFLFSPSPFLWTFYKPSSPRSPSIMFWGSGWMPWRSEKALSLFHSSKHQLQ